MRFVIDADCLIKLAKAQFKEPVCAAFEIALPADVRREVMRNAAAHPECQLIAANLGSRSLHEVASRERGVKGEEATLAVYRQGGCDGIASDDKRFIRKLRALGVPYVTAAVFILLLVRHGHLTVAEGQEALNRLAPMVSDDEVAVVRLKLQSLRLET